MRAASQGARCGHRHLHLLGAQSGPAGPGAAPSVSPAAALRGPRPPPAEMGGAAAPGSPARLNLFQKALRAGRRAAHPAAGRRRLPAVPLPLSGAARPGPVRSVPARGGAAAPRGADPAEAALAARAPRPPPALPRSPRPAAAMFLSRALARDRPPRARAPAVGPRAGAGEPRALAPRTCGRRGSTSGNSRPQGARLRGRGCLRNGVTEPLRVEESSEIIESNLRPNSTVSTRPWH